MRFFARARRPLAAAARKRSSAISKRKRKNSTPSLRLPASKARSKMAYVEKTHRFGLLTPSSNTVQEPEFSALLPETISLHTGRVAYRDITPQEQMRCVRELETESRKLADAEVDVIVFAATAPTLAKGKGYDRELIKRMQDASARPATTAATGVRGRAHAARRREDCHRRAVEQDHGQAHGRLHGAERFQGRS